MIWRAWWSSSASSRPSNCGRCVPAGQLRYTYKQEVGQSFARPPVYMFYMGRYLCCRMRFRMSFAYRSSFMPGDAFVGLYDHVNELTREGMDSFIEPLYILSHPEKIILQLQL